MRRVPVPISERRRAPLVAAAAVVALIALTAVVAAGPGAGATAHAQGGDRPNVVVVQTDDQDEQSLQVMRHVSNLIAAKGTVFRNYFATHPRCCPSRASYLTGQYSHNHGVQANNFADGGGFRSLDHSETLPVWLERDGYVTAHMGKYMNGYGQDDAIPPGWTEWYGSPSGTTELMWDYDLIESDDVAGSPARTVHYGDHTSDYKTDVLARKAVDFVRRRSGDRAPFFLSVNPLAPHAEEVGYSGERNPRPAPRHDGDFEDSPLPKPPSFNERDVSDKPSFIRENDRFGPEQVRRTERRYVSRLESLLAVDEAVRDIVRALREAGEIDNTLLIFTSDNGYFLGEHRLASGKEKLYEEAVQVPFAISGPGVPAGARRGQLAGNIDVAPTILDATGADSAGRVLDGRSLLPVARDRGAELRSDILLENGVSGSEAVRTHRYVYMEHQTREKELYDLRRDPYQLESRHGRAAYADTRRRLAVRLDQLRACQGRSCR